MKKSNGIILFTICIFLGLSCHQENKKKATKKELVRSIPIKVENSIDNIKKGNTYIKGKVKNWITDTVYFTTLPYHSPFSNETFYQTLSNDSTFYLSFNEIKKPIILQISPRKITIDRNINALLYDNLTEKHYFGQCEKFNTYNITTYLLEPSDSILVEINYNSWIEKISDKKAKYLKSLGVEIIEGNKVRDYGKSKLAFLNTDKNSLEYYQKWFGIDDKYDSEIEMSLSVKSAFEKVSNVKNKLISDLNQEKPNITPFLYEHLLAYIEFGAKKEFLKNLILEERDYLRGKVPIEILEFLEFDKNNIGYSTILCDQYNDYLEFYLTYKMNKKTGNDNTYYKFNEEKYELVKRELPKVSQYHYLANQLLHQKNTEKNQTLTIQLIKENPQGDLNDKLRHKIITVANNGYK